MIARGVAAAVLLTGLWIGWSFLEPGDRVAAAVGFAICLPPAVLTYRLAVRICRVRPDLGPVALMAGSGLRMAWAVGMVFLVADRATEWGTRPTTVANFTTGAYLLTLAGETAALARRLTEPRPSDVGPAG